MRGRGQGLDLNRTRYWFDRQTPGLSLLCADFTTHEYPAHIHDALMVAVTETGGSQIRAGGGPDEAHSAALLVVNPGEPHSSRMNGSHRWQYRSFYLERSAIGDVSLALGAGQLPGFSRNMLNDGGLIRGFLALHRALDDGHTGQLRRRELLVGTFGRLASRYGDGGARIPIAPRDRVLLDSVIEAMRDRYPGHVTLADLAAVAGLTQFQLIGLFRKGVGMTPHAYLTQIRLESARAALRRSTPIAEAAAQSGFYDQAALTRTFKRCYGITPHQFAQAARL
jgi:AraC-like DNA-binding protein